MQKILKYSCSKTEKQSLGNHIKPEVVPSSSSLSALIFKCFIYFLSSFRRLSGYEVMKRPVDKNKQMKESRNKLVTNYFYFLLMEQDTSVAGVYSMCQQSLIDFFIYEFLELQDGALILNRKPNQRISS